MNVDFSALMVNEGEVQESISNQEVTTRCVKSIYEVKIPDEILKKFSEANILEQLNQILQLFIEDCGAETVDCYFNRNSLFIHGQGYEDSNQLMLRINHPTNNLILARIRFINQRKGKMTKLYRMLEHIRTTNGFQKFVVECVRTKEMENWCIKNGFTKSEIYFSNYEIV